jgi:hypothetical protein
MQQNADSCGAAACDPMASEEELELNFEAATSQIMEVFKDPFFHPQDSAMELEEVDF